MLVEADEGAGVLLVVDLPAPGIEVVRTPAYAHHIADEHPIVSFTDVRVPASQLIGAEGAGMTFAQDRFRFERVMVAGRRVGAAFCADGFVPAHKPATTSVTVGS